MIKKRRCPNEVCGHKEYEDISSVTMTPQPYCPACMKEQVEVWDTEPEDEEVY